MKKTTLTMAALLVIFIVAAAIYFYLQDESLQSEMATVKEVEVPPAPTETIEPESRQVLEEPAEPIALPELASSDNLMGQALASLINNKALMDIFNEGQIIRNIVVTIDNLPRKQTSMRVMPIKKAAGRFMVEEDGQTTTISPKNSERYVSYIQFAEAVDTQKLIQNYINLYPLFQQSYEEIGYPDQYFNDRLLFVIDHLLATPELSEPVQLVQPKFYYQFADTNLEERSIGQRILMRIGSNNEELIKVKLQAIKQELNMHMHEQKLE
ncbi:MAG: DUF3014 domain-containing protein [Methylotenera sp.]